IYYCLICKLTEITYTQKYVCSGEGENNVPLVRYVNFNVNVLSFVTPIKCIFYTEISNRRNKEYSHTYEEPSILSRERLLRLRPLCFELCSSAALTGHSYPHQFLELTSWSVST
ncbi:unnamed protein product, partial [Heterotrigona itama]